MRSILLPLQYPLQAVEVLLVGGEAEWAELIGDFRALELLIPGEVRLVAAPGECDG